MSVICRRCLLIQMLDERPLYEMMREWLAALPDEERVLTEVYHARLAMCQECDELNSGLCGVCGCYVELRAAKAHKRCPLTPPMWE